MTGRAVLLFDADSELSRMSVRWVARHDRRKRLRRVAMASPEGQSLLASLPPSRREHSWHLLLDGEVYSGRDVLDPLLEILDRPLAARVLKRARGRMGRGGQPGPVVGAASPPPATIAPVSEAAVGGNGGPAEEPAARPQEPPPAAAPPPAVGLLDRPAPARAPAESAAPAEAPPTPEPADEAEPSGWQARIESSPFGRGILSVLILITLIAIVAINLPNSDLRRVVMKPGQPYLNALGLDQAWGVFAPDPRRDSIDVSAVVTYDDGRVAEWNIPRNGALIGSYTDYRWGKWEEFLTQPGVGSSLWLPAAEWAAAREARPGHTVKRVVLVERYRQLYPPGVSPSEGPTRRLVFYSLSLPGGARRGAQPQAPLPPGGGGL